MVRFESQKKFVVEVESLKACLSDRPAVAALPERSALVSSRASRNLTRAGQTRELYPSGSAPRQSPERSVGLRAYPPSELDSASSAFAGGLYLYHQVPNRRACKT